MIRRNLILHTEASHGWGGQEIRILTESRALIRRGFDVRLLADPQSIIFQRAASYGVPAISLRLKKKRMLELFSMIRALSALRPVIVVTHSSTDHWIVAIARFFLKVKPAIIRLRHISAPVSDNLATRWLYRSATDYIVTTSSLIRDRLLSSSHATDGKIAFIPTGIDLNFYKPKDKYAARTKFGISQGTFVFATIATLRSWKGHEDLLNAYASLANSESLLVLAGTGPQEDNLKSLAKALGIADNVLFLGHLDDPRPCLDLMDCFVFPSFANEGVPQAILQAMAYDLTIIGSDLPGVLEAVEGYEHFIKVPARDTKALANAMNGVLGITAHGKNANAEIRVRISVDTMANRMAKLYEEFIKR